MAPTVAVFLVWAFAIVVIHGLLTAPWRKAHARLLNALANNGTRPDSEETRLVSVRSAFDLYRKNGFADWFTREQEDAEVEQLRLQSLAAFRTARRRTYVMVAVAAVGTIAIFTVAARTF
jgi:alkylhydroperoxidase family enzyme